MSYQVKWWNNLARCWMDYSYPINRRMAACKTAAREAQKLGTVDEWTVVDLKSGKSILCLQKPMKMEPISLTPEELAMLPPDEE